MSISSRLHAVEHQTCERLDLVHFARVKEDRASRAEPPLRVSIAEQSLSFGHMVDLVRAGMMMDGPDLPRLPARDADVRQGRAQQ